MGFSSPKARPAKNEEGESVSFGQRPFFPALVAWADTVTRQACRGGGGGG